MAVELTIPLTREETERLAAVGIADPGLLVLLENPDLFISRYFGHRVKKLKPFHLRLLRTATHARRGLALYPAAHGKTTLVSTLLPIWRMCRNPDIRMSVIAKNEKDAENIGLAVQAELLGNRDLIRDFGPFEPPPDANLPFATTKLSIANRRKIMKEPTIAFFGAGSRNALGHRSDHTICDDIIHDQNSVTPERREKIREWFMQGPATQADDEDSNLTLVGTRFDPDDLYAYLQDVIHPETGEPIWLVYDEDSDAILDEDAKRTLWPEKWPWHRLMVMKAEMGTLDFNKRYRNIAVDKSRMVFREEYIRGGYIGKIRYPGCLDRSYTVGQWAPEWKRVCGFDPAVGLTRHAKFCAHLILAQGSCKDHERCYWIVDLARDQLTLPQQADLIIERHQRYQLLSSMVEANSYQGGLNQIIKERMDQRGLALMVEPHYTTRTNKPDPEVGVQGMQPWFENGKVHIPYGNPESQRKMQILIDELVQYPGRTTDTVMATWFAWRRLEQQGASFVSSNRLVQSGSFWGRGGRRRGVIRNPAYA